MRKVFGHFLPPGDFAGPWDRQKTARDETNPPRRVGTCGGPVLNKAKNRMSGTSQGPIIRGGMSAGNTKDIWRM
eukprot:1480642-Pyramimonas_sp.AAC.1